LIKRDNFLARPATQLHPHDVDDDSGEPRGQLRAALEAADMRVGGQKGLKLVANPDVKKQEFFGSRRTATTV
jgi:hypothetical protein